MRAERPLILLLSKHHFQIVHCTTVEVVHILRNQYPPPVINRNPNPTPTSRQRYYVIMAITFQTTYYSRISDQFQTFITTKVKFELKYCQL